MNSHIQNPMATQIGGSHYKNFAMQPAEFWLRNQLPSVEGAIVKYLTRHRAKNRLEDLRKVHHFVGMMLWFYFDAPESDRAVPAHLRGHRSHAISARAYCEANQLPPEESEAIRLVCEFRHREEVDAIRTLLKAIAWRDYGTLIDAPETPAPALADKLYLAKEQLENYLSVLQSASAAPTQLRRVAEAIDIVRQAWEATCR